MDDFEIWEKLHLIQNLKDENTFYSLKDQNMKYTPMVYEKSTIERILEFKNSQ